MVFSSIDRGALHQEYSDRRACRSSQEKGVGAEAGFFGKKARLAAGKISLLLSQ